MNPWPIGYETPYSRRRAYVPKKKRDAIVFSNVHATAIAIFTQLRHVVTRTERSGKDKRLFLFAINGNSEPSSRTYRIDYDILVEQLLSHKSSRIVRFKVDYSTEIVLLPRIPYLIFVIIIAIYKQSRLIKLREKGE